MLCIQFEIIIIIIIFIIIIIIIIITIIIIIIIIIIKLLGEKERGWRTRVPLEKDLRIHHFLGFALSSWITKHWLILGVKSCETHG